MLKWLNALMGLWGNFNGRIENAWENHGNLILEFKQMKRRKYKIKPIYLKKKKIMRPQK